MSACPLCRAALRDAPVIATRARFDRESRRVACAQCGLVQQDPLPNAAELDAYYRSHEYRRDHGKVAIGWGRRGVIKPSDPRWPEAHAAMGATRHEKAVRMSAASGGPVAGSVLDVGCGPGHVLDAYLQSEWRCYGLEPDEEEAAKGLAKGHAVETTTLERYERGGFDLIVAHHVLEHLRDPIGALRLMRGMLDEGGRVVIEVPNIMSPSGPLTHAHFQWVHLWDFSATTLSDAMCQAGLGCEVTDVGGALWAVAGSTEPREGVRGRSGEWVAGYLDGYRRFGGGD